VQNLHQREGPSRAAQLSGARRKRLGPRGGYCHLGGQGPLLENISLRALLGETYVTDNYNSSGVPGTGSALPLQTPGPRASGGAEGQHLQLLYPRLAQGTRVLSHTKVGYCTTRLLCPQQHRGRRAGDPGTELLAAAGQGAGLPCQPVRGDPATPRPRPVGWRSSSPPASGTVVASRGDNRPTNTGGATRHKFCTFTLHLQAA